ncbi:phosphotransferase family protein [Cohnella cholangitidis]|uniref:Phosphotransferase n=1 Tax=Cohnella cholangitidis TaxID=2598458 RepID=A0A7G5BST3_9BACL|nr:aminoglycoside phosphotransferase family protein [Cohnella cholangitidis]QMV40017.1 phosphotransferase [Cohnella cholangitidis]
MFDAGEQVVAFGRTAEIYAYGDEFILKLFRSGMPETAILEEYQVSKIVFNSGITTPQPIKLIHYADRIGIVYQRIEGSTMLKSFTRKPWAISKETSKMAALHAAIHGKTVHDLPSQRERLIDRIQHAPLLTYEEKEKILTLLHQLREDTKLCHGDFHPDNIIVGQREWIIDWMTGVAGNPAGDVARTLLLLQLGTMPERTPRIVVNLFSRVRKQMVKAYMKEYTRVTNLSDQEVNQWLVPVAAARLSEWIPEDEKQKLVELIKRSII